MLQIQRLSKSYGKQNVLQNFNLDIESGEIISVVGSSGSGKTTLLRLISGLESPDSGQITLKNKTVLILFLVNEMRYFDLRVFLENFHLAEAVHL